MRYQLVIFDLGGVVVELEADRLIHQVSSLVGRPFKEVQQAVYHPELLLPLELGRISPTAYYEGLKKRLQLPWTYDQFVRSWNDVLSERPEMTALVQKLSQSYTLLALTNTNALHLGYIKAQFPALAVFRHWVASCEVGLRKPDPQIYRMALERAGIQAGAAVYVDDRPDMAEAGKAIGLTAIRFKGVRQLSRGLHSLGVVV